MSAKFWNRLGYERELWQKGLAQVAGVDEAGCGPLAGPVVAASVVFPCSWAEAGLGGKLRGLNDSKQLTEEQRRVVGLRFWKDCKLSEIAAEMERSEQAVAKLLQRALKKLRELLGQHDLG